MTPPVDERKYGFSETDQLKDAVIGQKWAGNALKSQCSHTGAGAVD